MQVGDPDDQQRLIRFDGINNNIWKSFQETPPHKGGKASPRKGIKFDSADRIRTSAAKANPRPGDSWL